jgi:hypothetical protein
VSKSDAWLVREITRGRSLNHDRLAQPSITQLALHFFNFRLLVGILRTVKIWPTYSVIKIHVFHIFIFCTIHRYLLLWLQQSVTLVYYNSIKTKVTLCCNHNNKYLWIVQKMNIWNTWILITEYVGQIFTVRNIPTNNLKLKKCSASWVIEGWASRSWFNERPLVISLTSHASLLDTQPCWWISYFAWLIATLFSTILSPLYHLLTWLFPILHPPYWSYLTWPD